MLTECIIYDEKGNHILSAPSVKEAEWALDELRRKLPKYKNMKTTCQLIFLNNIKE